MTGTESTTPLADALAEVDRAQKTAGADLVRSPPGELRALRDLADAVRARLLAQPEGAGTPAGGLTWRELRAVVLSAVQLWEHADHDTGEYLSAAQLEALDRARAKVYAEFGTQPAGFTLDESRLADLADQYEIETDHDALLALETAIQGDHNGGPLLTGPCEIAVELLANGDGEPDGYRLLLRPDPDPAAPWLAGDVQLAADQRGNGLDTAEIIREFARAASSLLAWHRRREQGTARPADGIMLTRDQIREWAGLDLTSAQMDRLASCIPRSSIPDAVGTIVTDAMGLDAPDEEGEIPPPELPRRQSRAAAQQPQDLGLELQ